MFSGKYFQEIIYIYFLDFMCSHEGMCVYGRYAPDVYIFLFFFYLMTDVERRKGVAFFNVL